MTRHLSTGSAFGRFIACEASSVLPRVWPASSDAAEAGKVRHAFLQRISDGMSPDESLEQVPPDIRASCLAIDIEAIGDDLTLAAEVTLAYHPGDDTARIVGYGLDRDYSTVSVDELPMTLDLVGVDLAQRRGWVKDYKTGEGAFWNTPRAAVNWQIKGGTLALARTYDLDEVAGELLFTAGELKRDPATFTASDFMLAAAEMREAFERALRNREAYARGEHVEPTEGPHCTYCPCAWTCPAKTGLIRAALAGEIGPGVPPAPAAVADLWDRVGAARRQLDALHEQLVARIRREPIQLGAGPDGSQTFLGELVEPGDERLDPTIAIEAAVEVLGTDHEESQRELATMKVSKKKLGEFIRSQVPKGSGAAYERRVLAEIRARGGVSRPLTKSITTYTVRPPDEG